MTSKHGRTRGRGGARGVGRGGARRAGDPERAERVMEASRGGRNAGLVALARIATAPGSTDPSPVRDAVQVGRRRTPSPVQVVRRRGHGGRDAQRPRAGRSSQSLHPPAAGHAHAGRRPTPRGTHDSPCRVAAHAAGHARAGRALHGRTEEPLKPPRTAAGMAGRQRSPFLRSGRWWAWAVSRGALPPPRTAACPAGGGRPGWRRARPAEDPFQPPRPAACPGGGGRPGRRRARPAEEAAAADQRRRLGCSHAGCALAIVAAAAAKARRLNSSARWRRGRSIGAGWGARASRLLGFEGGGLSELRIRTAPAGWGTGNGTR
ncbi:hypothetical protein PVAP13_1KG262805 [Panicum virgatum]|uniref:Uncharacterized protein n=1 Tax=Panicum virgatum TaxID=38727 RepID=A0A8T0XG06_PANVG|nr:hypothetical protein PVAP13_1KG262805 [Panicum virgatum]